MTNITTMGNQSKQIARVTQDKLIAWAKEFAYGKDGKTKIALPTNYDVVGAVKALWLGLLDVKDKNGRLALEVCTPASIERAVHEMIAKGLDPRKKQCYPIVFGNSLVIMESRYGAERTARAYNPNLSDFRAQLIYDGDTYDEEVINGRLVISNHKHKLPLLQRTPDKIIGAYSTVIIDGEVDCELMSIEEIKRSWAKSKNGGQVHKEFPEEMCKKTVIKRHAKRFINTSDDSEALKDAPEVENEEVISIDNNENTITIDAELIDDTETESNNAEFPQAEPFDDVQQGDNKLICSECGQKITNAVANFSTKKFGKTLCYHCQQKQPKA